VLSRLQPHETVIAGGAQRGTPLRESAGASKATPGTVQRLVGEITELNARMTTIDERLD
jgi:hypothetical protein